METEEGKGSELIVEAIRLAVAAAQWRAAALSSPNDRRDFASLARGYSRRSAVLLNRFAREE